VVVEVGELICRTGGEQKRRDMESRPWCSSDSRDYGFFPFFVIFEVAAAMLSAFFMLSAFMTESILCEVSIAAAGAGAGAIAGVVVSFAASSDFEHAVTASTAATKARRFMKFS
jgi:hypothetical protein